MQFKFKEVYDLEETMSRLGRAAEALCDRDTNNRVADLLYIMAEVRVLAGNPRDPEAINRFAQLFTEEAA